MGREGPRNPLAESLVDTLEQDGRRSEAVEAARRLIIIAPTPTSRYNLARPMILADRPEQAETFLRPFVSVTAPPRDRPDALIPYAAALAHQGAARGAPDPPLVNEIPVSG